MNSKKLYKIVNYSIVAILVCAMAQSAFAVEWSVAHSLTKCDSGYSVSGFDPWLLAKTFDTTVPQSKPYLYMKLKVSNPVAFNLYWWRTSTGLHFSRMHSFVINETNKYVEKVIDLNRFGRFKGADTIRIGPSAAGNLTFDVKDIKFLKKNELPPNHYKAIVEMKCFTSRLHYLPGEIIEYKVAMLAKNYPQIESSKILKTKIVDENGKTVHKQLRHYGIAEIENRKEICSFFIPKDQLPVGKYTLHAKSVDQMTGFILEDSHSFGVIDNNNPYIYETPYKYVKDFSIIRDKKGLWHIFSITGDFIENHDWIASGNECTFSHGTSRDLRKWKYHEPVLSISDKKYKDGNGYYENKGVWAPNVIYHNGRYYLFYTSVNQHISQSVSLAVSDDLFDWKKYHGNPVFNLEGVEWANWARNRWADCRDPEILKADNKFYMYVTAHASSGSPRGIVVVCESENLIEWHKPQIAVRYHHAMESPQVWEKDGKFLMTTSAHGGGLWTSKQPDKNWEKAPFSRPNAQLNEKYVQTTPCYAEEVINYLGNDIIAGLTWRHYGNSIYIYKINYDQNGLPLSYESPFEMPSEKK